MSLLIKYPSQNLHLILLLNCYLFHLLYHLMIGSPFSHTFMKQKDYLLWKVGELSRLGARYSESPRKTHIGTNLRTPYLQTLAQYRRLFYDDGVKVIRGELLGYLNRLALAVWFMDDGTLRKRGKGLPSFIRLMTEGFTLSENELLLNILYTRFGITGHIEKRHLDKNRYGSKQTYYLELYTNMARRFASLVEPFIHSTMRYKLSNLQSSF
ncbi:hypothetical protein LCGC14_3066820 [marine sediment metagenome]|uniref:Homing endonuclease LAGLIDADG domain-containing protein n=1 Tax=marine sediment metagenome TaxID=412755 RepID=A0A0F8WH61_9ZZZZ